MQHCEKTLRAFWAGTWEFLCSFGTAKIFRPFSNLLSKPFLDTKIGGECPDVLKKCYLIIQSLWFSYFPDARKSHEALLNWEFSICVILPCSLKHWKRSGRVQSLKRKNDTITTILSIAEGTNFPEFSLFLTIDKFQFLLLGAFRSSASFMRRGGKNSKNATLLPLSEIYGNMKQTSFIFSNKKLPLFRNPQDMVTNPKWLPGSNTY